MSAEKKDEIYRIVTPAAEKSQDFFSSGCYVVLKGPGHGPPAAKMQKGCAHMEQQYNLREQEGIYDLG